METKIWTLTTLRNDDPRNYLDVVVFGAAFDKIQSIKYGDYTVYVISEKQYKELKSTN